MLCSTVNSLAERFGSRQIDVCSDHPRRGCCIPPIRIPVHGQRCNSEKRSCKAMQWTKATCTFLGQFLWLTWRLLEPDSFQLGWSQCLVVWTKLARRSSEQSFGLHGLLLQLVCLPWITNRLLAIVLSQKISTFHLLSLVMKGQIVLLIESVVWSSGML